MQQRVVKIDLHTHSYASPDGGITLAGYKNILHKRKLDYIAITDHNDVRAALDIKKVLGDRIIIGEEIMTTQGEIVGLYVKKKIEPGMDLQKTVAAIRQQGGLVYVPHPFETVRSGITAKDLATIAKEVDIIEIRNGRALVQNKGKEAMVWAQINKKAMAASSDAHSYGGLGRTYTEIPMKPTKASLVALLGSAEHSTRLARLPTLLSPKINRLKRRVKRS